MTIVSCQKKKEDGGLVSLTFPSSSFSAKSSKVHASAIDFAKVCYFANVTGGSITDRNTNPAQCDVKIGKRSDFKKSGESVELELTRGTGYTLQIFAYQLDSTAQGCPKFDGDSVSKLNLSKLFEVGKATFDMNAAEVAVTIQVDDPGKSVLTQYNMPLACRPANPPGNSPPILTSKDGYRLYRAVAPTDGVITVSSQNGYKLTLGKDGSE